MKGFRFFLFGFAAAAAFCAASLVRDQRNTFEKYPEWSSVKKELALGVVGGRSFTLTPITMLGRALNLAAWHGNQEVIFLEPWAEFPRIKFRVYGVGATEFVVKAESIGGLDDFAFRISSDPLRPSAWLQLGRSGQFLSRSPFEFHLPNDRWVEVQLHSEGNKLVVYVEGARITQKELPPGGWRISLRADSSSGIARFDDLQFHSPSKSYEQSFSGSFPYWLAAVLAIALFVFYMLLERFAGLGVAFGAGLFLASSFGLITLFYDYTIGNRYPHSVNLEGHSSNIEKREHALARLRELPEGKAVLLWLGGSQAWGSGASQPEKSVFGKLQRQFAGASVEFLNGAISGATLDQQLEVLRLVAARRIVKAVVITAGVNDAETADFPAKLALAHAEVLQAGAKLLLVPEPMKLPISPAVKSRHEELKAFAREKQVPFYDLPAEFEKRGDAGFLWWDFVHLSDAGAEIAAESLAPVLQELVRGLDRKTVRQK